MMTATNIGFTSEHAYARDRQWCVGGRVIKAQNPTPAEALDL